MSLEAAVAVVTGACSGIGRAIALDLLKEGAKVCFVARNRARVSELAREIDTATSHSFVFWADFEKDDETLLLAEMLTRKFEGIDILVHSAGNIALGDVDSSSVEDFDIMYRVNVRAPYVLTQKLIPALKNTKGQVVFMNSSAGLNAKAGAAQYAATKHGLKAISDSFREEVNSAGIRVISIYPGRTASPMQEKVCRMEGKVYTPEKLMQPEDVSSVVVNALKLPRTAEVTDISIRHHARI
ncbi:SDR family NAD(P)-dependent oxidoreductase [Gemmatimonadota bacterium]